MIADKIRTILRDKFHEFKDKTRNISRLGWIWLSIGFIAVVLVCAALWHYPIWQTDNVTNETASAIGFDDTPGYLEDMSCDSIVSTALNARIYSHGIALNMADESKSYDVETTVADSAVTHSSDPTETPSIDPYLDTPEE